jgi:hypothetical protein
LHLQSYQVENYWFLFVGSQTLFLIPFKKSIHPIKMAAFITIKYLNPRKKGKCILMFSKNLSKIRMAKAVDNYILERIIGSG